MSKQVWDIDTVGYTNDTLGGYFDFQVNNVFYLLAPSYYQAFYSVYLNRCLSVYDGWIRGYHDLDAGLIPQRMLQSIANGLNNMLFAHGIDFTGTGTDYEFATKWAKQSKLYKVVKKAHKFAIAGGTSLLKLNRRGKELYATAHRIDTFFVNVDASGKVVGAKVYFDSVNSAMDETKHYGICEERFYNREGKACVTASVYEIDGSLQNEVASRPQNSEPRRVDWEQLPSEVRKYIKDNYPSIIIGKPQYLPFAHSLGCYLLRFTDDIPQIPNTPFGQPIGDILFTESFQYDQMKYFEKNEVDLARARALVSEEFWNLDDPANESRTLNQRFYQKVSSVNGDSDKITPIQFLLRGTDMKTQMENIYKDCAFKLQISASSVATFLSEGAGARTATEIVNERTKTDSWIKNQIGLNSPEINDLLHDVMLYYNHMPVEIILKPESQSPFLETLKTNSDVFSAGNMTPEMFVKLTYGNLSQDEQRQEIERLRESQSLRESSQTAMQTSLVKE